MVVVGGGGGAGIVTVKLPLEVALPPGVVTVSGPVVAPRWHNGGQLAIRVDGEAADQRALEGDAAGAGEPAAAERDRDSGRAAGRREAGQGWR